MLKIKTFILRNIIKEKVYLRVLQNAKNILKGRQTNLVFGRFVLGIVGNSLLEIRLKYKFVTFDLN
jgi:hypothetical protein